MTPEKLWEIRARHGAECVDQDEAWIVIGALLAEVDRLRTAGERLADRLRISRGLRNSEDRANAVGDAAALAAWDEGK